MISIYNIDIKLVKNFITNHNIHINFIYIHYKIHLKLWNKVEKS